MEIFRLIVPRLSKINNISTLCRQQHGFATAATATKVDEHASQTAKELKLTFASPTKAFYANVAVKQVDVPGMASNMGILPIHVPTVAVLKPGILTVYGLDGNTTKFFVSSGSISMNIDGSCQLLAEEVAEFEDLDVEAAKQLLDSSNQKVMDPKSSDVEKAEAQIQADVADAIIKSQSGGH